MQSVTPDFIAHSQGAAEAAPTATVQQALFWARSVLSGAGIPSPRLDAQVLLAEVLRWKRGRLFAWPELELTQPQIEAYRAAVERRLHREPVPYIVGHRPFYGLEFCVDRRVLIPRPETELLVERALETALRLRPGRSELVLADVGTGSGSVAVSLAVNLPRATVFATEVSREALDVAAVNAKRHGVTDRVHLVHGDLIGALPKNPLVIVANLPYVATEQLASLARDVLEYEPLMALDGGPDGLTYVRRLLEEAGDRLQTDGSILVEVGADQGCKVVALASLNYPAADIQIYQDYAGLDRVVAVHTSGRAPHGPVIAGLTPGSGVTLSGGRT